MVIIICELYDYKTHLNSGFRWLCGATCRQPLHKKSLRQILFETTIAIGSLPYTTHATNRFTSHPKSDSIIKPRSLGPDLTPKRCWSETSELCSGHGFHRSAITRSWNICLDRSPSKDLKCTIRVNKLLLVTSYRQLYQYLCWSGGVHQWRLFLLPRIFPQHRKHALRR